MKSIRADDLARSASLDATGTPHGAILAGALDAAKDHYREAVAAGRLDDPVVVVEVLDRPAEDASEAGAIDRARGVGGVSIAMGVQARRWVSSRLRPCNAPAARAVRDGPAPGRPMTVVVISGSGISVVDLPDPGAIG